MNIKDKAVLAVINGTPQRVTDVVWIYFKLPKHLKAGGVKAAIKSLERLVKNKKVAKHEYGGYVHWRAI